MEMYTTLLKQGWTLTQIDEMDVLFYFQLIRYAGAKQNKITPVDDVGWL